MIEESMIKKIHLKLFHTNIFINSNYISYLQFTLFTQQVFLFIFINFSKDKLSFDQQNSKENRITRDFFFPFDFYN